MKTMHQEGINNESRKDTMIARKKAGYMIAVLCVLLAVIIFWGVGNWAATADTYSGSMDTLQKIQNQALGMTAGATGLATAAAAVPGDATTPLANKLMDLAGYMVVVFVVITAEKYLLTLSGALAFKILIPIALLMIAAAFLFFRQKERFVNGMLQLALRMVVLSLLLWAIVPVSLWTTNLIQDTYEASYEEAPEIEESTGGLVEKKISELEQALNRTIEGVAVMIVTTCVIPICVLFLFLLVIRTASGVNIRIPAFKTLPMTGKKE